MGLCEQSGQQASLATELLTRPESYLDQDVTDVVLFKCMLVEELEVWVPH